MSRIAQIRAIGPPEVIEWIDVNVPPPGPGEVRMRNTAIGLNYVDTYFRSGLYSMELPGHLGSEAAGVVEAIGDNVVGFRSGDRVATLGPTRGAYCTERNLPAAELVSVPDDVDDQTAAALLLKGATAEFLIERCAKVRRGQTVLVHAAAGGVGHLLVGWLKEIGASVIATVSTEEKALKVRAAGADHVLVHRQVDVAAAVREITGGKGVPVVLDGVGQATWETSLASTARRGLVVSYGNAGGPVEGVGLGALARHGSLFVTRPTLLDYYADDDERQRGLACVFNMLRKGAITPMIGQTFRLEEAAEAHRKLEAGETLGTSLLLP